MKNLKFHPLFYIILVLFVLTNFYCFSQQRRDSLEYYYKLIRSPHNSNDLFSALNFFNKNKEVNENKHDTLNLISDLRMIAALQLNLGFYYDSEASALEAIKLIDNHTDKDPKIFNEPLVGLYNQMGRLYRILHEYDVAIDYYQKAERIAKSMDNVNTIQNNIAYIYQEQGNYDLAEKKYQQVYENSLKSNDSTQLARAMVNLANVKSKLNRKDALDLMNEGYNIRQKLNDTYGIYSSYKHFSEYYNDRNDKQKALEYALKAFEIAKKINSTSYIEDALANLVQFNDDPHVIYYKRLTDSINEAKQMRDNKYALIKYNYFEQEKLAKKNELQKEKEKRLKQLYKGLGIFLLLGGLFIYFIIRAKNKREKIQQVYDTETRISKKVYDEVANDLYGYMTKLQSTKIDNPGLIEEIESIYEKTRDISKQNVAFKNEDDFENILKDLFAGYRTKEVNVITKQFSSVNWNSLPYLKKETIYRILQELLTNMKKHSKASVVVISFDQKGKKIYINYSDNGIGCDLKKKSGLQNVENRINSVKGSIKFESGIDKGFKTHIII